MDDLEEIAAMFAALDGRDRYASMFEAAVFAERDRATERTRQWRKNNPAKFRALRRRLRQRWRAQNRDKVRAQKTRQRKANPETTRATWRRNTKAYRDRKRAERAKETK